MEALAETSPDVLLPHRLEHLVQGLGSEEQLRFRPFLEAACVAIRSLRELQYDSNWNDPQKQNAGGVGLEGWTSLDALVQRIRRVVLETIECASARFPISHHEADCMLDNFFGSALDEMPGESSAPGERTTESTALAPSLALEDRMAQALHPHIGALSKTLGRFERGLQHLSLDRDPWELMKQLDLHRGCLLGGLERLLFEGAKVLGAITCEGAIPGYGEEVACAQTLRQRFVFFQERMHLHNAAFSMLHARRSSEERRLWLDDYRCDVEKLCADPLFARMWSSDRYALLELERSLQELQQGQETRIGAHLNRACALSSQLLGIRNRELLIQTDLRLLQEVQCSLERTRSALLCLQQEEGYRHFRETIEKAWKLLGRDAALDRLLLLLKSEWAPEVPLESVMVGVEQLSARIAHVSTSMRNFRLPS